MFNKIENKKLGDQVVDTLRKKILLEELKEGDHLKENELANLLGVSRGPIREAIFQLKIEGLVVTPSNGRTQVVGFSTKDIENFYKVRFRLESLSLEQISMMATDTAEYNKVIQTFVESYLVEDEDISNQADIDFHRSIISLSQNKTLIQLWSNMKGLIETLMSITNNYITRDKQEIANDHVEIVHYIQQGDVEKAQEKLNYHLETAAMFMKEVMSQVRGK